MFGSCPIIGSGGHFSGQWLAFVLQRNFCVDICMLSYEFVPSVSNDRSWEVGNAASGSVINECTLGGERVKRFILVFNVGDFSNSVGD